MLWLGSGFSEVWGRGGDGVTGREGVGRREMDEPVSLLLWVGGADSTAAKSRINHEAVELCRPSLSLPYSCLARCLLRRFYVVHLCMYICVCVRVCLHTHM